MDIDRWVERKRVFDGHRFEEFEIDATELEDVDLKIQEDRVSGVPLDILSSDLAYIAQCR